MNLGQIYSLIEDSRFDICGKKCTFDPVNHIYRTNEKMKLLKILMSNNCKSDCKYCPNAWKKGFNLSPEQLANLFFKMLERKLVDGIFISSSLHSDVENVMENIIEAGKIIREKFKGYIHLKIMPGSDKDSIKRALEIANRVSINVETVSQSLMDELSSTKNMYEDIIRRERWIAKEVKKMSKTGLKRSFTTQIIVGIGEYDVEIIKWIEKHYKLKVSRVYFSAFKPIPGTPFENRKGEDKRRVTNLYRVDTLIRKYGYKAKDFLKVIDKNLPNVDPKVLLAEACDPDFRDELIKVPGIGFKAEKLLRDGYTLLDLKKMGFSIKRAVPYLTPQQKLNDFFEIE